MNQNPDFSESFYRDHARRYAGVSSHNFIQSVYTDVSHPALKSDMDLVERMQDLVPAGSRGLDAGCGAGARDVYFYWQRATTPMAWTPSRRMSRRLTGSTPR